MFFRSPRQLIQYQLDEIELEENVHAHHFIPFKLIEAKFRTDYGLHSDTLITGRYIPIWKEFHRKLLYIIASTDDFHTEFHSNYVFCRITIKNNLGSWVEEATSLENGKLYTWLTKQKDELNQRNVYDGDVIRINNDGTFSVLSV